MFIEALKPKKQYTIVHTLCTAILCVLFSLPIVSDSAGANAPFYQILLDSQTQEKGFTVSAFEDRIKLGIRPGAFSTKELVVDIKDISNERIPMPVYKDLVSPIFLYDLENTTKTSLETPLMVAIKYDQTIPGPKNIYYWDKGKLSWNKVPTTIDEKSGYARAEMPFPFSIVSVFSEQIVFTAAMQEQINEDVSAASVMIINPEDGDVIYERNANQKRSIASISKLMSILVFLEHNPGWSKAIEMKKTDEVGGARMKIKNGETITVKDLFYTSLIGSKNNAVTALVRSTGFTNAQFTELMNQKAHELGMQDTFFAEPTGLSSLNTSTASDISKLAKVAFTHPLISEVSTQTNYTFSTQNTKRKIYIATTNQLLFDSYKILAGKTGYTPDAQHCLATKIALEQGNVIAIVLGSPEKDQHFADMKVIFDELIKENQ